MKLGDTITLGCYAGETVEWKAVAQEDGLFLLLSRMVLDYRPFHPVEVPKELYGKDYYEANWGNCELRQWLNGEFVAQTFTEEELTHLVQRETLYPTFYKTLHSRFPGEDTSMDRVFLLTQGQAKVYLTDDDRIARLTDHAMARARAEKISPLRAYGAWWLRTTLGQGFDGSCMYVYNTAFSGHLSAIISASGAAFTARDIGVRPAIWYQP